MDVLFFLKERTKFIRYFYETAGEPFRETKRKIEVGDAPFDNAPYSEDGEPPYLEEWMEAEEGLEVLGRSCLSLLSASLKLYFETWESELGVRCEKGARKRAFKRGFLRGYQECLGEVLRLSWDGCPAGLALVEQITLARNRDQHPDDIGSLRVSYRRKDLAKHPHPFFVSEVELNTRHSFGIQAPFWMTPDVNVRRDALFTAIEEVEKLAEWLEERMVAARYGG